MTTDKVRVSVASASVIGLLKYKLQVPPTTAYIMSYTEGTCLANCAFCAQARDNQTDRKHLSRVTWPDFNTPDVIEGFKNPAIDVLERICFQVINYPGFLQDTLELVKLFKKETDLPISVDICPIGTKGLQQLRDAGAEMIGIPLDGATPKIFDEIKGKNVKGPYRWEKHFKALEDAVKIFGADNVGSNIIVGMGETEKEVVELIQRLHDLQVKPVLFAFTPLKGTKLEKQSQPSLKAYRRIQAARHLIYQGKLHRDDMSFNEAGRITGYGTIDLSEALKDGVAFQTTGCPGCNRPFYNERPSGPFYNFPRPLNSEEVQKEIDSLRLD